MEIVYWGKKKRRRSEKKTEEKKEKRISRNVNKGDLFEVFIGQDKKNIRSKLEQNGTRDKRHLQELMKQKRLMHNI